MNSSVNSNQPRRQRVVAIGHSHLGALQFYCAEEDPAFELQFMQLLTKDLDPKVSPDAARNFENAVQHELELTDLFALLLSGNEHQMMGLVNDPRPFDFVLPDEPTLPLLQAREILPVGAVEKLLRSWMRVDLFETLSKLVRKPMYQFESPPPILDHSHILRFAGPFKSQIEQLGVNDPWVRYKLWRLSSGITRSICERFGIGFIPAPVEAIGPEGFLHWRALSPDAVHANAWYGRLLAGQIQELLDQGASK